MYQWLTARRAVRESNVPWPEAEYKILVRRLTYDCRDDEEDTQEALNDAAEELSADVTAHLGNGWSLHGLVRCQWEPLSVGTGMEGVPRSHRRSSSQVGPRRVGPSRL